MSQAKLLDYPIFTKNLGVDYYEENQSSNQTAQYKKDVFAPNKVIIGTQSIYSIGTYTGTADVSSLEQNPQTVKGFLIKTDLQGNVVWAKTIGNDLSNTFIYQIDVMESPSSAYQGIYICGKYTSNSTAQYNNIALKDSGSKQCGFVAKYTLDGQFIESYVLEPTTNQSQSTCLSISEQGLFVGSMFKTTNTLYKVTSSTLTTLKTGIVGRGASKIGYDIYIYGLNATSNLIFDKVIVSTADASIVDTNDNYIRDIDARAEGVYVLFEFYISSLRLLNVYLDLYNYQTYSAPAWRKILNSASNDYGNCLLITNTSVLIGGSQSVNSGTSIVADADLLTLFPSSSSSNYAFGSTQGYVVCRARDTSGTIQWAKLFSISNSLNGSNQTHLSDETVISITSNGNAIYILGEIRSALQGHTLSEFNGTTLKPLLTFPANSSSEAGYILKYDMSGNFIKGQIIDNISTDKLYNVTSKSKYFTIYSSKQINSQQITTLTLNTDIDEEPLSLVATNGSKLGQVILNITNKTPETPFQLKINNETPIDLSGASTQYIHNSALNQLNTYQLLQNSVMQFEYQFQPTQLTISGSQGSSIATIQLNITSHTSINFNVTYSIYRYSSALPSPILIVTDVSNIQYIDGVNQDISYNYYIIATSAGGVTYQSNTVEVKPLLPSVSVLQTNTTLGKVAITINNYNAVCKLYRKDTNNNTPVLIYTGISNEYIDTFTSTKEHQYYIVVDNIFDSITYTSQFASITPKIPTIFAINGSSLGSIILNTNSYSTSYSVHRQIGSNAATISTNVIGNIYIDSGAEQGLNTYYIQASVGGVTYRSEITQIVPIGLSIEPYEKNIHIYTYKCNHYNTNYILYDADSNRPIETYTTDTFSLFTKPVNFYVKSVSSGNKTFVSNTLNLIEGYATLVPVATQSFSQYRLNSNNLSTNKKVAIGNNYIYNVGSYIGSNTPGLPSVSVPNAFIIVSDFSGNVVRAINIGNSLYATYINQIEVREDLSAIFVCGSYQKNSTTTFTNISLSDTSASGTPPIAGFVARYDMSLNYIWSVSTQGSQDNITSAIAINGSEVFVGSNVKLASLTINTPTQQLNSIANSGSASQSQILIYKLNVNGQWISQSPLIIASQGADNNSITDMKADNNNLYILYQLSTATNAIDSYTACYTASNFSEVWSKSVISSGNDVGLSLSVNSSSVFVAGYCSGVILSQNDTYDVLNSDSNNISFIIKRNKANGDLQWVKKINSINNTNGLESINSNEYIYSICSSDTDLYVIGFASNYLYEWYKLNGFIEIRRLITAELNSNSVFILKYNTNGDLIYATQYDTQTNDTGYNIYKTNNYISIVYSKQSTETYYGLYKEFEPVVIATSNGPQLGTIDINISSQYNFTYKLFANDSTESIDISNSNLYTYLYALNGINQFHLQCTTADKIAVSYSFSFTPRTIYLSLNNFVKGKIEIIPDLYTNTYYSIERSTDGTTYSSIYTNVSGNTIDTVQYNQIYYYRINSLAPYSNITYYSPIRTILASQTISIDQTNSLLIASSQGDERTPDTIIPNKKIYMTNDSIYAIANYTQSYLAFPRVISNSSTQYGMILKTDYSGTILDALSIGNDVSNTRLHQIIYVANSGPLVCGSYSSNEFATYSNIALVNTNNKRAGFVAKFNVNNEFEWAYCMVASADAEITAISSFSNIAYFGANMLGTASLYKIDDTANVTLIESGISSPSSTASLILVKSIIINNENASSEINSAFNLSFTASTTIAINNYIRDIFASPNGVSMIYDINNGSPPLSLNTVTSKYTFAGELLWTKQISSNGSDYGYSLIEKDSNIIAVGSQSFDLIGRVILENDLTTLFSTDIQKGTAYIICRSNSSNATLRWAKQINLVNSININVETQEPIYSITEYNNSIYVCGQILLSSNINGLKLTDTTLLAPSSSISTNTLHTFTETTSDAVGFIIKYSMEGVFKWIKIINNVGTDFLTSLYAYNGYLTLMNNITNANQTTSNLVIFRDIDEPLSLNQTLIIPPTPTRPGAIPCIVRGALIKTVRGSVPIEDLLQTDIIVDGNNRKIPIKAIYKTKMVVNQKTAPYKIPKGLFSRYQPNKDLYLSPKHAFQSAPTLWQIPEFSSNPKIKKAMIGQEVQYYHIELPNYFTDNLVANGLVVESFAAKQVDLTGCIYKYSKQKQGFLRTNPLPKLPAHSADSPKSD